MTHRDTTIYNMYKDGRSIAEISATCGLSIRAVHYRLSALRGFSGKSSLNFRKRPLEPIVDFRKFTKAVNSGEAAASPARKDMRRALSAVKKHDVVSDIILSDFHIPYYDSASFALVEKVMTDYKFHGIIILGDFMDLRCISRWVKENALLKEGERLADDFAIGNAILDRIDKLLGKGAKKVYISGNHDDRLDSFIQGNPALEGCGIEVEEQLRLRERGYEVHSEPDSVVQRGRLAITHGMYSCSNHVDKHLRSMGTNVLYGHMHTMSVALQPSIAKQIKLVGYSVPCMCALKQEYVGQKPTSWTNGFAVLHRDKNDSDYFDVDIRRIVMNRVVYNGVLYRA